VVRSSTTKSGGMSIFECATLDSLVVISLQFTRITKSAQEPDSWPTDTPVKCLLSQGFQHDIAAGDSVALTGPGTRKRGRRTPPDQAGPSTTFDNTCSNIQVLPSRLPHSGMGVSSSFLDLAKPVQI